MPHAKRLRDRRVAWDVRALDVAVDLLPSEGVSESGPGSLDDWMTKHARQT
jgi:hypothetical protein